MNYSIDESVDKLELELQAARLIKARFPDATLRDIGNFAGWVSETMTPADITDFIIVTDGQETSCVNLLGFCVIKNNPSAKVFYKHRVPLYLVVADQKPALLESMKKHLAASQG